MPINKDELDSARFTQNVNNSDLLQANLLELAKELAYNYYSNSFGDEFNLSITRSADIFKGDGFVKEFQEKINRKERVRNILIVGAGASHDTYKGIPTGLGLIDEVKETYEAEINTIDFLRNKFEAEAGEILDITGSDKLNFENYLYLLSNFFVNQKDLREKIKEMTGFRYSISLFSEIVAHMLKHAFLDVVINFNFEETLDHAIEEEIGKGNYHNIISDGNCVELEQVLVDGRLKVPIYIKPHGTFSHKSTLRFTNRHYFDLPNDIRVMLEGLISGQRGEKEERRGKKQIQRVNLICVGFAMQSLEFNKILDKCLPPESVIYNINLDLPTEKEKELLDRSLKNFLERAANHGRKVDGFENDVYRNLLTKGFSQNQAPRDHGTPPDRSIANKLTTPLGEMFSVLWRITYGFFRDNYKPRSIARHEILSYLFYEPELGLLNLGKTNSTLSQRKKDRSYIMEYNETHPKLFRNRILVELALVLNRSNGMIDITELLKSKVGFYYKKYEEAHNLFPYKIGPRNTIFELVNQFSLERFKDERMGSQSRISDVEPSFPDEYESGKNLFVLASVFKEVDLGDPKAFGKAIGTIRDNLVKHFKALYISKTDWMEKYADLDAQVTEFGKAFEDMARKWNSHPLVEFEKTRFERTISIFYFLMMSPLLSRHFKLNFLNNFNRLVHNGKEYTSGDLLHGDEQTMLLELFRLFAKSASQHYFIIDPLPYSPVHYIWESFKRRNLIHTILGLSTEFNYLFQNGIWDALLVVSETGSLLNFLHRVDEAHQKRMQRHCIDKQVILICCYEAVRQLYPDIDDRAELIKRHKKYVSTELGDDGPILRNLTILLVNFNQHNHHVTIFLKSVSSGDYDIVGSLGKKFTILSDQDRYFFMAIGSLYNYRRGFSNSIDPIHIGLVDIETTSPAIQRDQEKMIDIFLVHIMRAFQFEFLYDGVAVWEKDAFLVELQELYKNDIKHRIETKSFLKALYRRLVENRVR